jgi:hypothetical protein
MKVQFTALLSSGSPYALGLGDCALRRSGITPATAGKQDDLARVSFSKVTKAGVRLITDSTIAHEIVDPSSFFYVMECELTQEAASGVAEPPSGFYGGNVIYREPPAT